MHNTQHVKEYLKDIRRATIYAALFLKELKDKKLEPIEDQLCDLYTNQDKHFAELGESLKQFETLSFNTQSYWHDQEVRVALLYLQDLIFEFPEEKPAILATRALESAKQAVNALKNEFGNEAAN
jgi:hypothetical protein